MVSFNAPFAVAVITLLTSSVSAASTWIGCVNSAKDIQLHTTATSVDSCVTKCAAYNYLYWDAQTHSCGCSNTASNINDMVGTTNYGGSCPRKSVEYRKTASAYSFVQCLSTTNGIQHVTSFEGIPTAAQCWDACSKTPTKYAAYKASAGRLTCDCFSEYTGKETNCGAGNTYVFNRWNVDFSRAPPTLIGPNFGLEVNPPQSGPQVTPESIAPEAELPAASAARRRRHARDFALQNALIEENPWCPLGYEACRIPFGQSNFECILPASELESCGGCVYGTMRDANDTSGVDCTALPGVSRTHVTCQRGACKASRCLKGYKLVNGVCIAK